MQNFVTDFKLYMVK